MLRRYVGVRPEEGESGRVSAVLRLRRNGMLMSTRSRSMTATDHPPQYVCCIFLRDDEGEKAEWSERDDGFDNQVLLDNRALLDNRVLRSDELWCDHAHRTHLEHGNTLKTRTVSVQPVHHADICSPQRPVRVAPLVVSHWKDVHGTAWVYWCGMGEG
jgi:hypothetical protein